MVIPAADGTLTQAIGFDDSVYFFALGQHLWMGSLPHRDFPSFIRWHSGGIVANSWLAAVVPDSVVMTVATIAFWAACAGAAAMVAMLLMRVRAAAPWPGGGYMPPGLVGGGVE